jgi:hypothetical protein
LRTRRRHLAVVFTVALSVLVALLLLIFVLFLGAIFYRIC